MSLTESDRNKSVMPAMAGHGLRAVRIWLIVVALMVIAMIVVGGATRLTDSGLSITEWKPIHGVVPPLNAVQWEEEFAKYREIPEFKLLNFDMDLAGFKVIFWWEWAHRLLGRTVGLVVLVPLVLFWAGGRLPPGLKPRLLVLLALGGAQGAIGWWMVASGLSERTDVSQYRLAIHLTLAFIILSYTVWLVRGLSPTRAGGARTPLRLVAMAVIAVVFLQIFMGGLVAGLDAGLTFNTWPLMDGRFTPVAAFEMSPWWINMFESVATVQWQHRMVAYVLLAMVVAHAWQARDSVFHGSARLIAILVLAQAAAGVMALLAVVPLWLALLHQIGAAIVLVVATVHLRVMVPALVSADVAGKRAG
ncbi:MAG: COX15/CtaA family protein [Alphaproteobacteria bacterium]